MIGGNGDAAGGASGLSEAISRSVGMGYRIVETYLQQSRDVAAEVSPGAANGNDPSNVADLAARMMRTTADLFEVWFQFWDISQRSDGDARRPAANGAAAAGAAAPTASQQNDGSSARSSDTGGAGGLATRVSVRLQSASPATVSVDLRPVRAGARLVLHSLRSDREACGRIEDVSITAPNETQAVVVDIRIRDGQPAGVYNGMIIDSDTSLPVGTVSVAFGEPNGA